MAQARTGSHEASSFVEEMSQTVLELPEHQVVKAIAGSGALDRTDDEAGFLEALQMPADRGLGQRQAFDDLAATAFVFGFQEFNDLQAYRVPQRFADLRQASQR